MPHHELGNYDDRVDLSALDFSAPDDSFSEGSIVAALRAYAPAEPESGGSRHDPAYLPTEVNPQDKVENTPELFTVTNPFETICVSALLDGRIHRVQLSPEVTRVRESELADEILFLADRARKRALAGQHSYLAEDDSLSEVLDSLNVEGGETIHDFFSNGIAISTPETVAAAQADLFAARYAIDG